MGASFGSPTFSMQLYLNSNSTLLKHITVSWINNGHNVFYLGDTTDVLDRIDTDTVLFNPSREDRYVPWNPIKGNPSVLADTFLDTWYQGQTSAGSSYYMSLEHLYLTASLTVLKENNLNLISLPYFLSNESYRERLLANVSDILVKDFWDRKIDFKDVASIYSKVYSLLLNPNIRRVFSSQRDSLNADVVLVDLDLPKTETKLFGSLMLSQTDHAVVVEDCSRYSPTVLISLINDGHPVLLGFEYRDQLDPKLYDAIIGSCNSANSVDRVWGPLVEAKDLTEFWVKHDRNYTRQSEKADGDIAAFLKSME